MSDTTFANSGMMAVDEHLFPWWSVLIQGIVALILGIFFLVYPYGTLLVVVTFLGIWWFVNGLFAIISLTADRTHLGWKLLLGILGIVAGILILAYPYYSAIIVPAIFIIIIGIWGVIMGFIGIAAAFSGAGWGAGLLGIIGILFGFIILFNPFITVLYLPYFLGAFGIIGGISSIAYSFMLKGQTG
jgi:uncharacterized membrane protein HdeD (DUF308 family)